MTATNSTGLGKTCLFKVLTKRAYLILVSWRALSTKKETIILDDPEIDAHDDKKVTRPALPIHSRR